MKNVGGQAVIEGVMMKGVKGWSVAVRGPGGDIKVKNVPLRPVPWLFKKPFVRGVLILFHALVIGVQALEFSAVTATEEEDEPMGKGAIAMTVVTSIGLAVVLFILLPLYATKLMGMVLPVVAESSVVFNTVDGLVRVAVFLAYVGLIGLWDEIRRVFEYHGAEHKVIHAFEEGKDMGIRHIMGFSPVHPRCGTSFLLIVMVLSIFVFSFIPQSWPFLWKFLARLVLLPLVAGLSYEALKISDRMRHNPVVRALMAPGLWLQSLTTREPTEQQVEVALRALNEVLRMEEEKADA
ncbi:MAG: DUF1385 domain-containing protein [Thermodesulfovibrionales bacterium]|nr:DUF1385 domain-containing protein [Thermodesulfovibrionales bacterium]